MCIQHAVESASDITMKAKLRELPCLPDILGLKRGLQALVYCSQILLNFRAGI